MKIIFLRIEHFSLTINCVLNSPSFKVHNSENPTSKTSPIGFLKH